MNIKEITTVVNSSLAENHKEQLIVQILAKDKNVIGDVLKIVEAERQLNKDLILDSNLELSRALVALDNNSYGKMKKNREFVTGEIKKHYLKWKDTIKCCFNIEGLP